ncbi:hypothetical protein ACFP47_02425 [Nesterenkonia lacusekhoensis]|uniref:Peptide chain release factor 1 n=1 Tax=Nesterenkonia lacusekhoensis TaxID=150832 RepID=A0ABS4T428_9MICC|nr:hypothetical protein [Nesterenkonia lacusekhoensis]MBP2318875.1 hypothetical protein [Nesterenkonia lacusekhoensis]
MQAEAAHASTGIELSRFRPVYEAQGPFATVYLEARDPSEDAADQVRLRWDALKRELSDAGAHEQAVAALEDALLIENITEVQTEGRVLVANQDGLLLEEHWDAALGRGDYAVLGEPAELGSYLRERLRSVRALVAVADQEGAVLRRFVLTSSEVLHEGAEESVSGSAVESVHKPREGALSHKQIQRTADEAAKQNIRDVVERLSSVANRWQPDVVVIAGEVQGRKRLQEELPDDLKTIAEEVESGGGIPSGSADSGAEDSLVEDLGAVAREIVIARAQQQTDRFHELQAAGRAVEGAEEIRKAVQLGAVETLLLRYGTRGEEEDELLRQAAEIDAQVGLVGASVSGDIAATLRYEAPVDQIS